MGAVIPAALLLSGCAALIYQLLWLRILHLRLGAGSVAVAVIVALFMLGLAIGGRLFGELAERARRPLRLYALLELLIAATSVASYALLVRLPFLGWLHDAAYAHGDPLTLLLARILVAGIVLLPPTACIGGTLPVLTKHLVRTAPALRRRFAALYALNTLGGLLGAALAGLLLVRLLGTARTLLVAALLNIAAALLILLVRDDGIPSPRADGAARRPAYLALLFLTGFVSIGTEVLLVRVLTIRTMLTAYVFLVVVSAFLAGIAAGSALGERLLPRLRRPETWFAALLLAAAAAGPATLLAFSHLPPGGDAFPLAFLAAFLFAALFGLLYPLGLLLFAGAPTGLGRKTGRLAFWNTLGALSGSLLVGLLLIPLIGIRGSGLLLALLPLVAGAWLLARADPKGLAAPLAIPGALLLLLILFLSIPAAQYRVTAPTDELLAYRDGRSGTVTVIGYRDGDAFYRELAIDSNEVAGDNPGTLIDAKLLAHLPLLLREQADGATNTNGATADGADDGNDAAVAASQLRVATVGYGTGATSASMRLHDADVVALEIEPAVVALAAEQFGHLNGALAGDPRFTLIIDDARNYLQATREPFDVIVTDVTNLKYKSNPYLYTADYFSLLRDRLAPGGVAAAWMPLGGLSFDDLRILLATFRSVFPHATAWFYSEGFTHFVILVGTEERLAVDLDAVAAAMAPVQDDLDAIAITDETVFASMLLLGEEDLAAVADGAALHTDDRPILEFTDQGSYLTEPFPANLGRLLRFQEEELAAYYPEGRRDAVAARLARVRALHESVIGAAR